MLFDMVAFACLLTGTYFDIRTDTESIPLWIFPTGICLGAALTLWITPERLMEKAFMFFIFFALFGFWSYKFNLGGADVLAFLMLAVCMGVDALPAATLAFLLSLPHAAYNFCYRHGKDYPFLPYILLAFVIVSLFNL